MQFMGLLRCFSGKESTYQCREDAGDVGLIAGLGRFPRGGKGNPLRYSFLDNSMDREDWWAAIHGVSKSQTYEAMEQACI